MQSINKYYKKIIYNKRVFIGDFFFTAFETDVSEDLP